MQRQAVNCPEIPPPMGPFSHLVNAGSALYLSGQVAQDPDTGKLIEGDEAAQTTRIFANLQAILKTADRDLRHIDLPHPARSTVAVKALPLGACIELECVAQ